MPAAQFRKQQLQLTQIFQRQSIIIHQKSMPVYFFCAVLCLKRNLMPAECGLQVSCQYLPTAIHHTSHPLIKGRRKIPRGCDSFYILCGGGGSSSGRGWRAARFHLSSAPQNFADFAITRVRSPKHDKRGQRDN